MEMQRDLYTGRQSTSPPIVPAQQEFLFVDNAKAKSSRQGRRNARSFVMQKARKENPWSTSRRSAVKQRRSPEGKSPGTSTPDLSHTPTTATPSPRLAQVETGYIPFVNPNGVLVIKQELCSDCQFFRCQTGQHLCPRCLMMRTESYRDHLDNNHFDPLGTTAVDTNGPVSMLLKHFMSHMAPAAIAVDIRNRSDLMRSQWFGTAMSNTAFMHSLLSTAALHQFYCGRGSLALDDILYHRMKAGEAINSALTSSNCNEGISDANIGAVFNLVTLEETLKHIAPNLCKDEQTDQRRVHYEGLRLMIRMRGGLLALGSNRILQAFILWHATAHAMATFELPYLSTDDLLSVAFNPRHPPGYRPNISQHMLGCCKVAQVRETLTTIAESVLILIADLNSLFDDARSLIDPVDIQNYACVLACMLMQWHRENENIIHPLEDALCVALLIFTVRTTEAFRAQPDNHPFHNAAIKKLEKALKATSRSQWQSCPDLLIYILAIGTISAGDSSVSSWFAHQASLACSEYGIHDGDALLDRLHSCGWVRFELDEAARHLWGKIIDLRSESQIYLPTHSFTYT
ncbi:hypothetical protein CC80DRAFT_318726 [Byssothecium circinans]|uniref:Zn(2)-C6 fungal-type domain-containing protein n=1 Tax=Byssothecium circinans TaxID=147558 RepID=A0A6A5U305_9PLEO|nr:hypothetical protein CC80DRAFT_318726 [Byssothecium circinans]